MTCYCCSNKSFKDCCEPYILGEKYPLTAETLMRSRYSAFCVLNQPYLEKTVAGKAKRMFEGPLVPVDWVSLDICDTQHGAQDDETGMVHFKAYFKEKDQLFCLNEKSQFEKIKGRWFYVDGETDVFAVQ